MNKSYEEKFRPLFNDEKFNKKFAELTTLENVGGLFAEFGVEMTEEEICDFIKTAVDEKMAANGELGENALDNVSGGAPWYLVGAAWGFAEKYWGGTQQAVQATYDCWHRILWG